MEPRAWLLWLCLGAVISGCPGGGKTQPAKPAQRTLTVRSQGPGAVVSEPTGIYCGDTCTTSFNRGTVVTLLARTRESGAFVGWGGACGGRGMCMVSLDSDQTVTATWTEREPALDESSPDAGAGSGGVFGGADAGWQAGDRDGDGMSDVRDQCPDDPEDLDGFEDADGCPDLDNDGDGIADVDDMCPSAAEDRDGFEEEDGCPDPDNDQDGIPDFDDHCPNEPETMNGFDDYDGCPDRTP